MPVLNQESFDEITRANAFALFNGVHIRQTGEGIAEASLEIGPNSLNHYGVLHGGAYYTRADCAAGAACRTDGRKSVTLHGSLDFIRSAKEGRVTARAEVKHRGRTTCLVSVEISGPDGTEYASGHYTFLWTGQVPAHGSTAP